MTGGLNVINLLADHSGNDVILGAQCWSLLPTAWALSSGLRHQPWLLEVHVSETMHNIHHCHHSRFIHKPFSADGVDHPIHLITKTFLCWGCSLTSIHMGHISSHFLPIQRGLSTYLFPRLHGPPISNHVLSTFNCLTIQPNHRSQPMSWYIITCLATSPSKQNEQAGELLSSSSHWENMPSHYPSAMPQEGAIELQL